MAERRMFAKTIIDSDAFLEMPQSTQLLYFHLSMRADDDGFVNKPKAIMKIVGCKDDDMSILIAKKFLISFDTGVIVIKHWKIHNYIRNDRYNETKYVDEKSMLEVDENNSYRLTSGIPVVSKMDTQVRLGKDRLGKDRIDNSADKPQTHKFTPPTIEEVKEYCSSRNNNIDAQRFIDFYECKGWMVGKNKMKDWKAAVRNWESRDNGQAKQQPKQMKGDSSKRQYDANELEKMLLGR